MLLRVFFSLFVATVVLAGPDVFRTARVYKRPQWNSNEKVSNMLALTAGERNFLVEFHPHVSRADAESIVLDSGLRLRSHPDLLPQQYLAFGSDEGMRRLTSWEEVAYIFPASEDLVEGTAVVACRGPLTEFGGLAQYIATVGDGWDGPGLNAAELTYSISQYTDRLPAETIRTTIGRALDEWARYARLRFTFSNSTDGPRNINFIFASGAHGDSYPFDGTGQVLAHTYFPPPNPEPIAGDLHLDKDENWQNGVDMDLFSVVLHEAGHALGLGHADSPGAVMYPYYRRVTELAAADKEAILTLYAPATAVSGNPTSLLSLAVNPAGGVTSETTISLRGRATGGSAPLQVSWRSDKGKSGSAVGLADWVISGIPLAAGPNLITVVASDAVGSIVAKSVLVRQEASPPAPAAPTVSITPPPGQTNQQIVTLTGTASANVTRVRWTNDRGGAGVAQGTQSWSAQIGLSEGTNAITVTASTADNQEVTAQTSISYAPPSTPAPAPGGSDRTAPTVTIISPPTTSYSTAAATLRISGTARDNIAVTGVTWSNSEGDSGTATGTANWTADVPLLAGTNTVTIRAKDAAGNIGWRTVVITRR